jgi:hypothetical protein
VQDLVTQAHPNTMGGGLSGDFIKMSDFVGLGKWKIKAIHKILCLTA